MYEMTQRQATALANQETFLGLRSHRTTFADREAFETYWELISKRCDTTARKRATTTPAERAQQRPEQVARSVARFQDAAHLEAWGREYATRYQPSVAKLKQQLARKCPSAPAVVEQVMERLGSALHDDIRALELAEGLQRQGRHAGDMRTKLRQRLFTAATIERCLETLSAASGSVLDAESLARKAHKLQRKGLSQQAMRRKMTGAKGDGELVQNAVQEALGESGDGPAIRAALVKLARKQLDRRKVIQRLMAKGFRYAEIMAQLQLNSENT
jgi:SOS response regulatory protein OraA/RecX